MKVSSIEEKLKQKVNIYIYIYISFFNLVRAYYKWNFCDNFGTKFFQKLIDTNYLIIHIIKWYLRDSNSSPWNFQSDTLTPNPPIFAAVGPIPVFALLLFSTVLKNKWYSIFFSIFFKIIFLHILCLQNSSNGTRKMMKISPVNKIFDIQMLPTGPQRKPKTIDKILSKNAVFWQNEKLWHLNVFGKMS